MMWYYLIDYCRKVPNFGSEERKLSKPACYWDNIPFDGDKSFTCKL